jgi:hypothetical protein
VQWSLASYVITAEPGGQQCTSLGLGGEQACTVTGLENNQPYTFTAQLLNLSGVSVGGVSVPSNVVTPTLLCRPLVVSVNGFGDVTTSPLNSQGCAIGSFTAGTTVTVMAQPDRGYGIVTWTQGGGDTVLGPQPDIMSSNYTFTVSETAPLPVLRIAYSSCQYLTLGVDAGDGSVVASPSKSAGCGALGYGGGAWVTIKALPAPGWTFNMWSSGWFILPTTHAATYYAPLSFNMSAQATFSQVVP